MVCQRCKQAEATHHSQISVNGFFQETHLCAECARQAPHDADAGLPSLLSQLMGLGSAQAMPRVSKNACPQCGLTLDELKRSARCGCAQCYAHFHLEPSILRSYGRAGHTGRVPAANAQAMAKTRRREQLQAELKNAITAQAFERAAELRDELLALEEGGPAQ